MKRRKVNRESRPEAIERGWDRRIADHSSGDHQDPDLLRETCVVWSNLLGFDTSNRLASEILTGFNSLVDFLQHHVDIRDATASGAGAPLKNVHETFEKVKGGQK